MTETEAKAEAERQRQAHDVPADAAIVSAELRFILVSEAPKDEPGPARDVRAWVVRFEFAGGARWVELSLEDETRKVIRVAWSR